MPSKKSSKLKNKEKVIQPIVKGNIEVHIEELPDKYALKLSCSAEAENLEVKAFGSGLMVSSSSGNKETCEVIFPMPIDSQSVVASKPPKESLEIEIPKLKDVGFLSVPISTVPIQNRKFLKGNPNPEKGKRNKSYLSLVGVK